MCELLLSWQKESTTNEFLSYATSRSDGSMGTKQPFLLVLCKADTPLQTSWGDHNDHNLSILLLPNLQFFPSYINKNPKMTCSYIATCSANTLNSVLTGDSHLAERQLTLNSLVSLLLASVLATSAITVSVLYFPTALYFYNSKHPTLSPHKHLHSCSRLV